MQWKAFLNSRENKNEILLELIISYETSDLKPYFD